MFDRSLNDYGGPLTNYAPVTDPTTDEDAKFRNRYAADCADMIKTAPRAIVRFTAVTGANPTDPAGFVHVAMWGSISAVKPTVTWSATGVWHLTWPTTVQDDLSPENPTLGGGVIETVSFRTAYAQATPVSGVLKHAVATVTGPNTITVNGYVAAGTADDIAGAIVTVVAW